MKKPAPFHEGKLHEKYFYEVVFDKPGGLVMPIIIDIEYDDGTLERRKYPAQVWRKNDSEVRKVLTSDKKIVSIKLKLFSKNAPKQGSIHVHRLNIANSAWREGGNCGGTVIGGNRNEVTWMHLVDYGGFPAPPPSWASRTAGPTSPGVDFDKEALGAKKNSEAKIKEAFDIEFSGDLTMLIDDWSLASPIDKLKDKGGNPCWTVDWNWSQPAAETANEGILLRGSEGSIHEFYTSESDDLALRPQLIIKYQPRSK